MAASPQPVHNDALLSDLIQRTKRLVRWLVALTVLFVVAVSLGGVLFWWKARAIEESRKELAFSQFVTDLSEGTDFVTPQVNTIQFLRHGYSITFDSVKYTQDGLVLTGTLGNPTELWISSLALNLSARPYPYNIKEKWLKASYPWWDTNWDIGSGQTTVGLLNAGSSVLFAVTIPNVKQTRDPIEIAVWFSGERYSYMK